MAWVKECVGVWLVVVVGGSQEGGGFTEQGHDRVGGEMGQGGAGGMLDPLPVSLP
jgi:hypothetical protein